MSMGSDFLHARGNLKKANRLLDEAENISPVPLELGDAKKNINNVEKRMDKVDLKEWRVLHGMEDDE